MSPEERDRFEQFHGIPFPPLQHRNAWIATLMRARPELRYYEAMKEWQQRVCEAPVVSEEAHLKGNIVIPPPWFDGLRWLEWIPWDEI